MFRLSKSGSLFFRCVFWLFLASLFCDGANLDDLCRGVIVLHDDGEVGTPAAGVTAACTDLSTAGCSLPVTLASQASSHAVPRLCVIIDQDSPSLEAGTSLSVCVLPARSRDAETLRSGRRFSEESLHIRFRHLLI